MCILRSISHLCKTSSLLHQVKRANSYYEYSSFYKPTTQNNLALNHWYQLTIGIALYPARQHEGWRMVKSETRRDADDPSPRLFGKKFRDSKK